MSVDTYCTTYVEVNTIILLEDKDRNNNNKTYNEILQIYIGFYLCANAALTANAFTAAPSLQQQRVTSTQHNLVVDADIIGQLALALPVGLGIVSRTNAPTNKDINTLARENIDVLSSEYVDLSKYPKYVDEYNFSAKVRDEGNITEKEVRALFDLWNSALATGDSAVVANRYTKARGL